jgi:hypothetical protein
MTIKKQYLKNKSQCKVTFLKKYQFRYLADGVNWFNDAKADAYIHSVYGNCDNSVIVI